MSPNGVVDTDSSSNSGPTNSDIAGGSDDTFRDMSAMMRAKPKPEDNIDNSGDNRMIPGIRIY